MKSEEKINKYNRVLFILIIVLVILILLTSIILTSRTRDYSEGDITTIFLVDPEFDFRVKDKEQSWKSKETVDLFAKSYTNNDNQVIVQSGNNDNVIAPNTTYDYDFDISNIGNVPLNYTLYIKPKLYIDGKKQELDNFPIDVRIRNGNNTYFYGTKDKWKNIDGLTKFKKDNLLKKDRTDKYIIEWIWNSKSDSTDTHLGATSALQDINLKVDIEVVATLAEKDLDAIPVFSTTQQNIGGAIKLWPFVLILLLILIIIILMIYTYVKLRKLEEKDKRNARKN